MLDSINNDLLHLPKAHERHQISQSRNLHHAVHMAELLQKAQHGYTLQRLAVLLKRNLLYWASPCQQQKQCSSAIRMKGSSRSVDKRTLAQMQHAHCLGMNPAWTKAQGCVKIDVRIQNPTDSTGSDDPFVKGQELKLSARV